MTCEMVNIVITGTDNLTKSIQIEITPNPVYQKKNIRLENVNQETLNFQLFNSLGQVVKEMKVSTIGGYQLNVENFASGMYYYVLKDKDGQVRKTGNLMKGNF